MQQLDAALGSGIQYDMAARSRGDPTEYGGGTPRVGTHHTRRRLDGARKLQTTWRKVSWPE